jgi:Uncharacterized protein conserved in bacteria (DUF2188)
MHDPNAAPSRGPIPSGPPEALTLRRVEPDAAGRWKITAPASLRASAVCDTRAEALWRAAAIVANAGGGTVRVYDTDGTWHDREVAAAPQLAAAGRIYRLPRMTSH